MRRRRSRPTPRAVLYVADDSIVADAVAPVRSEHRADQRLANATRAILWRNALIHEIHDVPCCVPVELVKLLPGRFGVINLPSQGLSLLARRNRPFLRPCGHVPSSRRPGSSLPGLPSPSRRVRADNTLLVRPVRAARLSSRCSIKGSRRIEVAIRGPPLNTCIPCITAC